MMKKALPLLMVWMLIAADVLQSWNDGAARRAIVEFVGRVTREGGPDFVPVAERIATFDNDGTLWAEKPLPFQLLFAFDRVKEVRDGRPVLMKLPEIDFIDDKEGKPVGIQTHRPPADRGVRELGR
jgi:hypothetical protein